MIPFDRFTTVHFYPKIAEVRVNKLAANVICILLTVFFCVGGVLLVHMLPHYGEFAEWHAIPLLVLLVVFVLLHEVCHAVGLCLFARVRWAEIRFGFMWRALIPYCHCTVPIQVSAYRRMTMLPLWITGGASLLALLIFPTDVLGLLAGIVVAGCVGDVWVVLKLSRFSHDLWVQDSPSDIGCDVLASVTGTGP